MVTRSIPRLSSLKSHQPTRKGQSSSFSFPKTLTSSPHIDAPDSPRDAQVEQSNGHATATASSQSNGSHLTHPSPLVLVDCRSSFRVLTYITPRYFLHPNENNEDFELGAFPESARSPPTSLLQLAPTDRATFSLDARVSRMSQKRMPPRGRIVFTTIKAISCRFRGLERSKKR